MSYLFARIAPQDAGIRPEHLKKFYESIADPWLGVHGFMAVRHGKVVSEAYWQPYAAEKPHTLFSTSKSITGLAVGFAVEDGFLSLDDRVVSWFPERLQAKTCENMERMTVRDLLTMSTGFAKDPHDFPWPRPDDILATGPHCCHQGIEPPQIDWVRNFFDHYVAYEPGTEFVYCTHGTFMLSVIVQKATGKTVSEYMNEKLFLPLGIGTPSWESNPDGYTVGGWGLMLTTEQLAAVGQFLLNGGIWQGKQLLSSQWIQAASSVQMPITCSREKHIAGYGYQMWVGEEYGAYFMRGAFGQVCAIVPEKDMVFSYFGENDKKARAQIWENILKYILDPISDEPVSAAGEEELQKLTTQFSIPLADGGASWKSETARRVSGKTYVLGDNRLNLTSLSLQFAENETQSDQLTLGLGDQTFSVPVGYQCWLSGKTCVKTEDTDTDVSIIFESVSCCGGWKGDHYVVKLCFDETCYVNTMDISFAGNGIFVKHSRNCSFYDAVNTMLTGIAGE